MTARKEQLPLNVACQEPQKATVWAWNQHEIEPRRSQVSLPSVKETIGKMRPVQEFVCDREFMTVPEGVPQTWEITLACSRLIYNSGSAGLDDVGCSYSSR